MLMTRTGLFFASPNLSPINFPATIPRVLSCSNVKAHQITERQASCSITSPSPLPTPFVTLNPTSTTSSHAPSYKVPFFHSLQIPTFHNLNSLTSRPPFPPNHPVSKRKPRSLFLPNTGPDLDPAVSMAWLATVGPVEEKGDGQGVDRLQMGEPWPLGHRAFDEA